MRTPICWVMVVVLLLVMGSPYLHKEADAAELFVARSAINDWPLVEGQPLPKIYQPARQVSLACCRGEYEPASVVLTTKVPLQAVTVIAETTPPLPIDIRAVVPVMTHICWDGVRVNCLLVHDPSLVEQRDEPNPWLATLKREEWRNPHVSFDDYVAFQSPGRTVWAREPIDTETLQPQDVTDRAQWWLTVYVPEDTAAGTYAGSIKVVAAGELINKVPLTVRVPAFDLEPDPLIRSAYYPTYARSVTDEARWDTVNAITDEQYIAENRDMVEHGCTRPTLYAGPKRMEDGTLDWSDLDHLLAMREQAGMPKGLLFAFDCPPIKVVDRPLTDEEYAQNVAAAREVAAGAAERGYEYCMMGWDEASGDRLARLHDSYASLQEGGIPVWVACYAGYSDLVGDVLGYAIVSHHGALIFDRHYQWQERTCNVLANPKAWDWYALSGGTTDGSRRDIAATHRYGYKVLTYMDPGRYGDLGLYSH